MKKRLESELISIAHRVLKLKGKSDVDQLYLETQKLYQTLSVLKFYNENFEQLKSELSQEDLEAKLVVPASNDSEITLPVNTVEVQKEAFAKVDASKEEIIEEESETISEEVLADESQIEAEKEIVSEEIIEEASEVETEESVEEPVIVGEIAVEDDEEEEEVPVAEAKDALDFEPIFEMETEEETPKPKVEEKPESKSKTQQISFEDLLGQNYTEPVFVKPNDVTPSIPKKEVVEEVKREIVVEKSEPKITNINEKFAAGINVGLNDRIAFVKNLFANSDEDYNRVISQLNTFDSLQEAQEFIEDMVKPDYNDWKGKEEYAERFMEIVERKFV